MTQRPELLKGRDYLFVLLLFGVIFFLLLSIEFFHYKHFVLQTPQELTCKVLNQYEKTKKSHTYNMLKLDCDGKTIYTSKGLYIGDVRDKIVQAEFHLEKVSFLGFLKGFYARSGHFRSFPDTSYKAKLNAAIASQHKEKESADIYKALFTAAPQERDLRQKLSALGISHLMAISGFHIGVLSAVLFFLVGFLYKPLQSRYFPYRNANRDLFLIVGVFLFGYVWFLDFTPSLLRSFGMLLVGYFLYDRGLKVISIQMLLLTVLLLIAFFPKLLFSLGFWLSVSGVYYIFLFLLYFGERSRWFIFFGISVFVYVAMLPFSLYIFGTFSLYHPFAILWTILFSFFYPLSILLHVSGFGGIFDGALQSLLSLGEHSVSLHVKGVFFYSHLLLSLLALRHRFFLYLFCIYAFSFLIYAVENVA